MCEFLPCLACSYLKARAAYHPPQRHICMHVHCTVDPVCMGSSRSLKPYPIPS
jgi:hypothetical protein